MKNNLFVALSLPALIALTSCAHPPYKGEAFQEVVIRNASSDVLTNVQLTSPNGKNDKAIQTNAIYPFSQLSLGFSPQTAQGEGPILSWQQAGTTYTKHLKPDTEPVKGRKEVYIFTAIVTKMGEVQITVEPIR